MWVNFPFSLLSLVNTHTNTHTHTHTNTNTHTNNTHIYMHKTHKHSCMHMYTCTLLIMEAYLQLNDLDSCKVVASQTVEHSVMKQRDKIKASYSKLEIL